MGTQSDGDDDFFTNLVERVAGLDNYIVDSAGNVFVVDPPPDPRRLPAVAARGADGAPPFPFSDTFLLHSNPDASKVIYLDFDGHITTGTRWNDNYNDGDPIITPAYSFEGGSSFSNAEKERIQNIWERVAEDFLPFNVDVTTEDPGLEALRNTGGTDDEWGVRVVVGENTWYHPAGGVAAVGSFNWNSDTPAFVFTSSETGVAEAASHEVGHALGLLHDGRTTPSEEYYEGHGTGATGWAPIMGAGYDQELVQWSRGEYPNASNTEDDLDIITSPNVWPNNGFGYRTDDHGSSTGAAGTLGVTESTVVFDDGIIERSTDRDFFAFTTGAGTINLNIGPSDGSPNLDVLATLYDFGGGVIATSNPYTRLDANLNLAVAAGTYYVSVEGVGRTGDGPGGPDYGYSGYGSLGYYSISGTIVGTSEVAVEGSGRNINDGDNSPGTSDGTDFGTVTQGGSTAGRTFYVYNDSNDTLLLSSLRVPSGYTITDGLASAISPWSYGAFTVRLDTASAGTKNGQIRFNTNDSDENPFNFSITGTVSADTTPWHYLGQSMMAQDMQSSSPYEPINPATTFYQTDEQVLWWAEFVNVDRAFTFTNRWYRPDGTLHDTWDSNIPHPSTGGYSEWSTYRWGSWVPINGDFAENYPGQWRFEVSATNPNSGSEEVFDTKYFTLLEDQAASPTVSKSHDHDSIDFTVSDNTQLKRVTIDWNDGSLRSQAWYDIFQSSLTESVGIDTDYTGTISYTITAVDTSNNSRIANGSFLVDREPPVGSVSMSGAEEFDGNAATLDTPVVRIDPSASDNSGTVAQMRYHFNGQSWGSWQAYSGSPFDTTLPPSVIDAAGGGPIAVSFQYRDAAGNDSSTYGDTLTISTVPFIVTELQDTVGPDGSLSLREAVLAASLRPGEAITFDPALFNTGPATITLGGTELSIAGGLAIEGPGAELLTIDAAGQSRVFYVDSVTATISGLTITGGSAADVGGGIFNDSGTLTVTNSTLSGNSANYYGGGIYNGGTLSVTNSTLSGNSATTGAFSRGGGIYNGSGTLTVTNSTLSGNSTFSSGGGIYNYGTLTVTNSIVAYNTGDNLYRSSGTVALHHSLTAMPDGTYGIYGDWSDDGGNLLGADPMFVRNPSPGADGLWGTEDDDFGDLRSRPESPAMDAGSNTLAVDADGNPLVTDIVGNPRILDGDDDGTTTVDIGAFEYASSAIFGSFLYYRDSWFDGGSGDAAIAADKRPRLPGETATAANYSNFDAGINGLMVDVNRVDDGYEFSAADFVFRVGNQNDPNSWSPGPEPSLILTRPGDGMADSVRVNLAWPNDAIRNTWLEVTVLANANTGLLDDYMFYFGNAVSETGNDPTNAMVNAADVIAIRDHSRGSSNPAGIDNPFDINRDTRVDALDMILARDGATSPFSALRLIELTGPVAPGEGEGEGEGESGERKAESGGGIALAAAKLRRDRDEVSSRLLGDMHWWERIGP